MKKIFCLGFLIISLLINAGCGGIMPEGERIIMKAYHQANKEKTQNAIKILEEYRNTHPTMPYWTYSWLIEVLSTLYEKEGKTDKAIRLLKELLEKQPCQENAYFHLAGLYLKEGLEQEAHTLFEKGKKLCIANSELLVGKEYEKAKRFDKAIEIYNKTIIEIPNYSKGYTSLGNAYRQKGNLNVAISNYEKAIELNPMQIEVWDWLGGLYAISGKKEKAEEAFEQIIKIFPNKELVKMANGVLNFLNSDSYAKFLQDELKYIKEGDMNVAIETCKNMINHNPHILKWHFYLAVLYSLKENNEEAKQEFKKVISIAPNSNEAKLSKAIMRSF